MTKPIRRARRPIAVSLTGGLAMLVSVFHFVHGLQRITAGLPTSSARAWPAAGWSIETRHAVAVGAPEIVFALVAWYIALNFLRLRPWAWLSLVLWVIVSLVSDLLAYMYSQANFASMLVNAVLALSIVQADIQSAFGIHYANQPDEA